MHESNNPITESPTAVPTAAPLEADTLLAAENDNKKSRSRFLLLVLLVFIVTVIISAVATLVYKNQSESKNPVTPTVTKTAESTVVPTIDPYQNWEIYEYASMKLTLKHPQNWTVTVNDGDDGFRVIRINISNASGEYTLQINATDAGYGGHVCLFPDSYNGPINGQATTELSDYIEINGKLSTELLRRNKTPLSAVDDSGSAREYTFLICENGGKVANSTDVNPIYNAAEVRSILDVITEIYYLTPREELSTEELQNLDLILSSIEINEYFAWDGCTNEKLGYSFKIPDSWSCENDFFDGEGDASGKHSIVATMENGTEELRLEIFNWHMDGDTTVEGEYELTKIKPSSSSPEIMVTYAISEIDQFQINLVTTIKGEPLTIKGYANSGSHFRVFELILASLREWS